MRPLFLFQFLLLGPTLFSVGPQAQADIYHQAIVYSAYKSPQGLYVASVYRPGYPELLIWGNVHSSEAFRLPVRYTQNEESGDFFRIERSGFFEVLNPTADDPTGLLELEWSYRRSRFLFVPSEREGSQLRFQCEGRSVCWQNDARLAERLSLDLRAQRLRILPPHNGRLAIYGAYISDETGDLVLVEGPEYDPQKTEFNIVIVNLDGRKTVHPVLSKELFGNRGFGIGAGVKLGFSERMELEDHPAQNKALIRNRDTGSLLQNLRRLHGYHHGIPVKFSSREAKMIQAFGYELADSRVLHSPCAGLLDAVKAENR